MNNWTLLINLTLKSTLVLALAWLLALALARRSAAARHIVWTAAFATLLVLPLLSVSLPSWPHPFANAILPADSGLTFHADTTADGRSFPRAIAPASRQAASPAPAPASFDPRRIAIFVWTGGALFAFLHLLLAYGSVWRLRRTAVASAHDPAAFGIDQPVALLEIAEGMPMTAGVFRPAIFLPADAAAWSWERLRIVVAHEYAHIRRGDAAAQLLARAALCLHWFNPLAWIAWRALLKERERAADDLVLASGAVASDYAGHLLEIARTLQPAPVGAAAGIAMARRSELEGRLIAILDSNIKRSQPGRAGMAVALLLAFALAAPLATVRAQSQAEQLPADLDATIAEANARKNHELLEQTAASYEKLRKFAEAQKLREAALAIRKLAGNTQYVEGLVRLGNLAQKRLAADEAMQYFTQAVQAGGDTPETAPALINLGLDAALRGKNPTLGIDYLQRARNAARSGNQMGRAMTWLAFLKQDDPARLGEVEAMYRAALSMEDIGSAEQAFTTELLARFLRNQERTAEAEPLEQSAIVTRKNLAASRSTNYQTTGMSSVMRVGGGVKAPSLLFKVEPSYTEEARGLRVQGTVLVKVIVDVDGRAKNVQIVKGVGMGLDEKAVEAINAWMFKPAETAGGVKVPVEAQIEVNFKLL